MDSDTLMLINFKEMRPENVNILFPREESPGRILVNRRIFKDPQVKQFISSCHDLNLNQKHRFEIIPLSEDNNWQTSHTISISYRSQPIETATKLEISIHRGLKKIIKTLNVLPMGIGIYTPENSLQIYGFDLPENTPKEFLDHVHFLLDPEYETFRNSTSLECLMLHQRLFPDENSPGSILKDKNKIAKLCDIHGDLMVRSEPFIGGEILFQKNMPVINLFTTPQTKIPEMEQNLSAHTINFKDGLDFLIENNKLPFEIMFGESRSFLTYKHIYLRGNLSAMNSLKEQFNLNPPELRLSIYY